MSDIKIGDRFWIKDTNQRTYINKELQYHKHFIEVEITGETSRSFVVNGHGHYEFKAPKKDPFKCVGVEFGFYKKLLTRDMVEDDLWSRDHRYKLIDRVRALDVKDLKSIAELIGYEG